MWRRGASFALTLALTMIASPGAMAAPASADLSTAVKATTDAKVHPGESSDYQITVTSHGSSAASNVRATDTLPAGLRFVSSADGCTAAGQLVTCGPEPTVAGSATKIWTF